MQLTVATRSSALARQQTARVIQLLQRAHPGLKCSEFAITPYGDRELNHSLPGFSGKRLFPRELEEALLSGKVHATVHSLKDLPVDETTGIVVAAIPERESAHDALVSAAGWTLSSLPDGARIGTSSLRRASQLLSHRPDLAILPLRGNVETRLQKLMNGDYDAIVLAEAALIRLGLQAHITEVFSLDVMLPAPGQGALAVQCRAEDVETLRLLEVIHNPRAAAAAHAERAFLASLGGESSLPVGAYAENDSGNIILTGAVLSIDGKQSIRLSAVDTDPHKLGERLAGFVLERGAAELLRARV